MARPWKVAPENVIRCRELFPKWLRERGGIAVYENHVLDSSHLGDVTYLPLRYQAENDQWVDAPADEWRPHGGLPSLRQQRVDTIKLEEFGGDVERALACFEFEVALPEPVKAPAKRRR